MTYEVLRPVTFDRTYQPGDVVTVDGARPRLLRSLVERRYIQPTRKKPTADVADTAASAEPDETEEASDE